MKNYVEGDKEITVSLEAFEDEAEVRLHLIYLSYYVLDLSRTRTGVYFYYLFDSLYREFLSDFCVFLENAKIPNTFRDILKKIHENMLVRN